MYQLTRGSVRVRQALALDDPFLARHNDEQRGLLGDQQRLLARRQVRPSAKVVDRASHELVERPLDVRRLGPLHQQDDLECVALGGGRRLRVLHRLRHAVPTVLGLPLIDWSHPSSAPRGAPQRRSITDPTMKKNSDRTLADLKKLK